VYPELFTFPGGLFTVRTYGFFLMVGFLTGVWLAMRRAARVGVDVDRILDGSFVLLLGGVAGARIFYVVHYWQSQFADRPNKLLAIIDLRQGGLEFLGGLLGSFVALIIYFVIKKQSTRLLLDFAAPSAMWGLALGRVGCFFNGCCFGNVCTLPNSEQASLPWAVRFPYYSPPHLHHWDERLVTIPAELISNTDSDLFPPPSPVPDSNLHMKVERREGPRRALQAAHDALARAKTESAPPQRLTALEAAVKSAEAAAQERERELAYLRSAQRFPSRVAPERRITVSELEDLAVQCRSLPVHPVQLYATVGALLLSGVLTAVFYRRKRHGVVIGLLFVLYPLMRFPEEMLRVDNPHDVFGLSISQAISVGMFVAGIIYLWVLYTRLPERSPYADAAAPPPQEMQNAQ